MFEKLKQVLKMMTVVPVPFDPARFGDQIASQTEWTPAKRGGASFRTHKLAMASTTRIEFRAAFGALLFYLLFFLAGLGAFLAISIPWFLGKRGSFDMGLLIPICISWIFIAVGAYLFYAGTAPIVFEKGRGVFWKGRKGPDDEVMSRNRRDFVRLDQIHAVQLIAEYITGKNSYYSYEMNLVMADAKRITVIDHGNLERIREDAKTLAMFLGKPLWDATIN
ncbi:MAG: hypothetical protein OEW15_14995 [Nitrospirota bacterium]|nr:hypothetical protein [Nitrospirota bacterium]